MGVVYLARDPNIERLVAVKVLRQDRIGNETFVRRFVKEAKVIGRLSHPNTVTVHDIGEEHGEVFIAMEYIEGISLSDIIKEKRLDVKDVVDFGIQIAETLEYAHHKGVVHRDIKPSNILVQPDGQIKITDFGIARIDDSNASIQTQAGETMGTPSYMSPEQVLGQTVDGRSDLFSLGVVLYELSTGKRPFGGEGKTLATVFNDIIQITPPDPKIVCGQVPHKLSALIMKALQKVPSKRFQSGRELADALKACLAGVQKEAGAALPSSAPQPGRKIGYALPLAGAALLAVIGGGIYLSSHHGASPPVKPPVLESRPVVRPEPQHPGTLPPVKVAPQKVEQKPAAPSIPLPAAAAKMAAIPEKGMTREVPKPPPLPVPPRNNVKPAVKPEAAPVKETKPAVAPLAVPKQPVVKQEERQVAPVAGAKSASIPTPAAAEKNGNGMHPPLNGEMLPLTPVKAKPLPKFAFLRIRTIPKGAMVSIDGTEKGTSPLTIKLGLGTYKVTLSRTGYRDREISITLDKMREYPLTEKLKPAK